MQKIESQHVFRIPVGDKIHKHRVRIVRDTGRLLFPGSPFGTKDELKAFAGSNWDDRKKLWSADDCPRNWFQIDYLERGDVVYKWFDRPVTSRDYSVYNLQATKLGYAGVMPHQIEMSDAILCKRYQFIAGEAGVGKTLPAMMAIELSNAGPWWWVGPKSSLINIKREFRKWGFFDRPHPTVEFLTYDALVKRMKEGCEPPVGLIADESSKVKHAGTHRAKALQHFADLIRQLHGKIGYQQWHVCGGYVVLMSGTPAPKSPVDWWSQCEIVWPGFLREGSPKALEQRLGFFAKREFGSGVFNDRIGWKDDDRKCETCGEFFDDGDHVGNASHRETTGDGFDTLADPVETARHKFKPSVNEIDALYQRLRGLVLIKNVDDCLELPDLHFQAVELKPADDVMRAARVLVQTAPNTITGLSRLRELSDGFQYRETVDGTTKCNHCLEACGKVDEWFDPDAPDSASYDHKTMLVLGASINWQSRTVDCPKCHGSGQMPRKVRTAIQIECPKDQALRDILDSQRERGRIVIAAGFQAAVDRVADLCRAEGWATCQLDGRGVIVSDHKGKRLRVSNWLEFWETHDGPVAYVANPESGGMSFTLIKARVAVFWSNVWKPEYREQFLKRIHRPGQTRGCTVFDLLHLPSDARVLEVIRANRKVELMTLGQLFPSEDIAA